MPTKQTHTARSRRILVIEDNPEHARLLSETLTAHFAPVQIHTVDSVDDGIELAGRHRYDAIFLDAFLRNRSVVHHLPSLCSGVPGTPVLVLAGSGDESLAAEAVRRGATDYFIKNRATLDRFPALVRKYLTAARPARPRARPTPPLQRLLAEIGSLTQRLATPRAKHSPLAGQLKRLQALVARYTSGKSQR